MNLFNKKVEPQVSEGETLILQKIVDLEINITTREKAVEDLKRRIMAYYQQIDNDKASLVELHKSLYVLSDARNLVADKEQVKE